MGQYLSKKCLTPSYESWQKKMAAKRINEEHYSLLWTRNIRVSKAHSRRDEIRAPCLFGKTEFQTKTLLFLPAFKMHIFCLFLVAISFSMLSCQSNEHDLSNTAPCPLSTPIWRELGLRLGMVANLVHHIVILSGDLSKRRNQTDRCYSSIMEIFWPTPTRYPNMERNNSGKESWIGFSAGGQGTIWITRLGSINTR